MQNFKQIGRVITLDNYVIQTGVTITAGSMVFGDLAGTGVIHPVTDVAVTAIAEWSGLVGVLTETLTGAQTGCFTLAVEGVYRFSTTAPATHTGTVRLGCPVWAAGHDKVIAHPVSGSDTALTAAAAVGIAWMFPQTAHASGTTVDVFVKLFPPHVIPDLTAAAGIN